MTFDFTMETINHVKEIKFQWKIRNFSKLPDEVEGPPFIPVTGNVGYLPHWRVVLKFGTNTNSVNCSGNTNSGFTFGNASPNYTTYYYLTVFLKSLDEERAAPTLKVNGNISLQNSAGGELKRNAFDVIIKAGECVKCWNLGDLSCKLPSSVLKMFPSCSDDVFVLEWSMTVSGVLTSIVAPLTYTPAVKKEEEETCNALKTVYKKNTFTDVAFHIGGQTIMAHKAILSARSVVFEKMFEHDTLDQKYGPINIKDIEYRIFDCFIEYVYTKEIRSEVKDDVDSLLALYEVADKYEVSHLQRGCADILLSCFMDINNVVSIVEMADMHNDEYLKEPAKQYIRHKFPEVAATSAWAHLLKSNVELASNIVSYVTTFVKEN